MPPGPLPKDPRLRQRRNKSATAATLTAGATAEAPKLPAGIKRKETRAWWKAIWESPMAAEWLPSDSEPLLRLAVLVEDFWTKPTKELAAEISKAEARFGLTPYDRHRMDWKVEQPSAKPAARPAPKGADPRELLRVVK
jgi:hypothetical protein